MDELALAERLIAFDTSSAEGLRRAAEFVGGWLESRDIKAEQTESRGLPVTTAEVGPAGRADPGPARPPRRRPRAARQFEPRLEGDRLLGRGAYDMKGALAVMLLLLHDLREQDKVRLRLGIVSDEESEEEENRGSDALVAGRLHRRLRDHRRAHQPPGRGAGEGGAGDAARGPGPRRARRHARGWGTTRSVKAVEVFRGIESLPFARHSSALFDRPSINLGRIWGGDALNKVPDTCVIDVDIRFLPDQDPDEILEQVARPARHPGARHLPAPAGRGRARVAVRARASARRPRRTIPSG